MKKLLSALSIIFCAFCIAPAHCACAPGDENCATTRDGTYSAECEVNGDNCSKTGATTAKCKPIDGTLRCTAYECGNGYYLWFYNGNSMGICYTKKMAENYCENPKYCADKNCEPKFEKKMNYGKNIDAFTGCVKKTQTPVPPAISDDDTPEQQTPDDEQSDQTITGCTLTFANGESIENINIGESAKPEYNKTVKLVNNTRTITESFYQIPIDAYANKFIQNTDSFSSSYNENIPHLFDLTKVNNKNLDKQTLDDLQKSAYVWFNCTDGNPNINTNTVEEPVDAEQSNEPQSGATAEVICYDNQCRNTNIFDQIDDKIKYLNDTKLSVWRDADGNFNTARLASDSIAGVVLGTAGGVITSKIVKKNQIKNGFEDLKCTIGGQVVATYGDEFTVGVK
ncbi:MAG: hypothetical protein ACLRFM_04115 [Alphaproteobacteria bacterium]